LSSVVCPSLWSLQGSWASEVKHSFHGFKSTSLLYRFLQVWYLSPATGFRQLRHFQFRLVHIYFISLLYAKIKYFDGLIFSWYLMVPSGAVTGKATKQACTILKITLLGHERKNFFCKTQRCVWWSFCVMQYKRYQDGARAWGPRIEYKQQIKHSGHRWILLLFFHSLTERSLILFASSCFRLISFITLYQS